MDAYSPQRHRRNPHGYSLSAQAPSKPAWMLDPGAIGIFSQAPLPLRASAHAAARSAPHNSGDLFQIGVDTAVVAVQCVKRCAEKILLHTHDDRNRSRVHGTAEMVTQHFTEREAASGEFTSTSPVRRYSAKIVYSSAPSACMTMAQAKPVQYSQPCSETSTGIRRTSSSASNNGRNCSLKPPGKLR